MAGTRTEYEVVTQALKMALKRQRVNYKELSKRLGLSESGVKKILTAKDGSFQRVAQIAKELGLSLKDLFQGENESMFDITYTQEQQEYLLANPRVFRFYWALVFERRSQEEARKKSGITEKELFSVLHKLDKLQFIELLPKNRLRIPPVRPIRMVGGGPLVNKLYQEWSVKLLKSVARPDRTSDQFFLIRYFRASQRTFDDLNAALHDLEAEFLRRAVRDMRSDAPDLVDLRWVIGMDGKSFLDD